MNIKGLFRQNFSSTGLYRNMNSSGVHERIVELLNSSNIKDISLAKKVIKQLILYRFNRKGFLPSISKDEGIKLFNSLLGNNIEGNSSGTDSSISINSDSDIAGSGLNGEDLVNFASTTSGEGQIPNILKNLLLGLNDKGQPLEDNISLEIRDAIDELIQENPVILTFLQENKVLAPYWFSQSHRDNNLINKYLLNFFEHHSTEGNCSFNLINLQEVIRYVSNLYVKMSDDTEDYTFDKTVFLLEKFKASIERANEGTLGFDDLIYQVGKLIDVIKQDQENISKKSSRNLVTPDSLALQGQTPNSYDEIQPQSDSPVAIPRNFVQDKSNGASPMAHHITITTNKESNPTNSFDNFLLNTLPINCEDDIQKPDCLMVRVPESSLCLFKDTKMLEVDMLDSEKYSLKIKSEKYCIFITIMKLKLQHIAELARNGEKNLNEFKINISTLNELNLFMNKLNPKEFGFSHNSQEYQSYNQSMGCIQNIMSIIKGESETFELYEHTPQQPPVAGSGISVGFEDLLVNSNPYLTINHEEPTVDNSQLSVYSNQFPIEQLSFDLKIIVPDNLLWLFNLKNLKITSGDYGKFINITKQSLERTRIQVINGDTTILYVQEKNILEIILNADILKELNDFMWNQLDPSKFNFDDNSGEHELFILSMDYIKDMTSILEDRQNCIIS